jgi:hypothetical protein
MRTLTLSLLFFAAADPSFTGKWRVHTSIAGNDSEMSCTFTQKDDDLSGKCVSEQGTFDIAGKITGKKIVWRYKSEYNGTPLTVNYDGALDSATTMKGSVEVPEFAVSGDFTASISK